MRVPVVGGACEQLLLPSRCCYAKCVSASASCVRQHSCCVDPRWPELAPRPYWSAAHAPPPRTPAPVGSSGLALAHTQCGLLVEKKNIRLDFIWFAFHYKYASFLFIILKLCYTRFLFKFSKWCWVVIGIQNVFSKWRNHYSKLHLFSLRLCNDALKYFMSNIWVTVLLPELSGMETMLELGLAVRGEGSGNSAVAFTT